MWEASIPQILMEPLRQDELPRQNSIIGRAWTYSAASGTGAGTMHTAAVLLSASNGAWNQAEDSESISAATGGTRFSGHLWLGALSSNSLRKGGGGEAKDGPFRTCLGRAAAVKLEAAERRYLAPESFLSAPVEHISISLKFLVPPLHSGSLRAFPFLLSLFRATRALSFCEKLPSALIQLPT